MGVKISNLPAIVTPALTDVFPVVQAGVTYKETITQLGALFNGNFVQLAPSGNQTITGNYGVQAYNLTATNALIGGNLELTGNTLSSTNANGDIASIPNGTGQFLFGSSTPYFSPSSSNLNFQLLQGGKKPILLLADYVNDNLSSSFRIFKTRSTTIGAFTTVQNGDSVGRIIFSGDDGTAVNDIGILAYTVSGSVSTGVIPTAFTVSTTNTSGVNTAALTIANNQVVTLAQPLPISSGGTGVTSGATIITTASISGTTQAAAINTRYIVANAGQTTITLPTTFAIGDVVIIKGIGAAGWILAANTGRIIQIGQSVTTSGGSLTSAGNYDSVQISGLVANSTWSVDYVFSTGLTIA